MKLYVDETENDNYFIVAGLLVNNEQEVNLAYKRFKKYANSIKIKDEKERRKVFAEFKSTLIDRRYRKLKHKMIEEICSIDHIILYSVYIKKSRILKQSHKEKLYLEIIREIVINIKGQVDVVYDTFKNVKFQSRINLCLKSLENVVEVMPTDSQRSEGLQFVDNICSVLRMHESNIDEEKYYNEIENRVKKIETKC